MWGQGHLDALDTLVSSDYVRVNSSTGHETGAEAFKAEVAAVRAGFPDLRTEIDVVIADGDQMAVFWRSVGTHTEAFLDVPPTHRQVSTSGSNLMQLVEGKVVKETVTWDSSELLASLGIRSLGEAQDAGSSEVVVDDLSGADPEAMKGFNRQFVTGVTVVTTMAGEEPKGLAVNSYASISLDPPLVLVCVQKTSSSYPALFAASHLGINIISAAQKDVLGVFAQKGVDKFASVDWHEGPHGSPLIDGSAASIEAEIRDRFQARTHTLFVCRVAHAELTEDDPMIYRAGQFFHSRELEQL